MSILRIIRITCFTVFPTIYFKPYDYNLCIIYLSLSYTNRLRNEKMLFEKLINKKVKDIFHLINSSVCFF